MAKLIAYISTSLVLFLLVGMVSYFRYYAPAGTFLNRDLDAATIVRDVQALNDIAMVQYVVHTAPGDVKVTAGVNLSAMTQYDVIALHGKEAVLRLPAARLVSVSPSEDEDGMRKTALQMGILQDARGRAETCVRAFLRAAGGIVVRFE